MRDFDFGVFAFAVAFVLFFAMMFGALFFNDAQRAECKKAAIEKGMTAVEIQAVCSR
jgi:hypothetical protein